MNIKHLMKQAQQMQEQMQQTLTDTIVEGTSGGGMVKATMRGTKELVSIQIEREVVDPAEIDMLQDLIVAAVNEANRKVEEVMQQQLGGMTGGMKMPGLF